MFVRGLTHWQKWITPRWRAKTVMGTDFYIMNIHGKLATIIDTMIHLVEIWQIDLWQ